MNYKDARNILGLPDVWDEKVLAKAYRRQARLYHPDKNSSEEAALEFDLVKRAYDFLNAHGYEDPNINIRDQSPTDYSNGLGAINKETLLNALNGIDSKKVAKLFDACKDIVNVSRELLTEWRSHSSSKTTQHVIKTSLKQMLNDELYMLKHGDETLPIPLWYPSAHFELDEGNVVSVSITPDLPNNVSIDDENNITVIGTCDEVLSLHDYMSPNSDRQSYPTTMGPLPAGTSIRLKGVGLLAIDEKDEEMNVKQRGDVIVMFK